jgi:hypothetical protein
MAAWQDAAAPTPRDKTAAAARLDEAHAAWDTALAMIDETRKTQVAAPGLQASAKKALATLDRGWDGLAAHRDYPMVSLDNNAAERIIHGPVVTRRNACGSRNDDSARLAAVIWTVTATIQMAGFNPPDLAHCLPRRMRPQCRQAPGRAGPRTVPALERQPRKPPHLGAAAARRIKPHEIPRTHRHGPVNRPRWPSACPSTGLPNNYVKVRVMDPVNTGKNQYPNGYVVYMNQAGQSVNPLTGQTVGKADPYSHIPLR